MQFLFPRAHSCNPISPIQKLISSNTEIPRRHFEEHISLLNKGLL
jgi:hypothetical protein